MRLPTPKRASDVMHTHTLKVKMAVSRRLNSNIGSQRPPAEAGHMLRVNHTVLNRDSSPLLTRV